MTDAYKRKLIEVALPLEAINRESAAEKAIRNGHPTALHLWWARRPLAACRALLFAQLVDDPSSRPAEFPTDADQSRERARLFGLIERLLQWDTCNDSRLLAQAKREIEASSSGPPPLVLDPFAGGGAIPLEAQRLGLDFLANDLNPVAVLIERALTQLPAMFSNRPPVNTDDSRRSLADAWDGTSGIVADYRFYASWMLEEARNRVGKLYPPVELDNAALPAIAWIWARTVPCANPACGADVILTRSFALSKKRGREAYVKPHVAGNEVRFTIERGPEAPPGTASRAGATCIVCGSAMPLRQIQHAAAAGNMGARLLAIAAQGTRQRVYAPPSPAHEELLASLLEPVDAPDMPLSTHPQYMGPPRYGMTRQADLYTRRQMTTLLTFSDLVLDARERVRLDAVAGGLDDDDRRLVDGGRGARAYADAIGTLLAFTVDRLADLSNSLCRWEPIAECPRNLFGKQTVSMTWDFAEGNPLGSSSGSWQVLVDGAARAMSGPGFNFSRGHVGRVQQGDARNVSLDGARAVVTTDPPYYDNVPYADLADFFYVWLRRSLGDVYPTELATMLTPKREELVADSQRLGGRAEAARYFREGFEQTFANLLGQHDAAYPAVVYYAFKQSETEQDGEEASTGWETLLDGLLRGGWSVTATWPIRTENASRMRGQGANALASSIALACRPRAATAETTTRRRFIQILKDELPGALREMQQGSVAPVDLAQSAIGPGMAVFSRFRQVVEADGSPMTVRTALALINQVLDEVLAEQEGDFDSDTRFCVKWFSQFGWDESEFGHADQLSRSTNTSVEGLVRGGIFWARAGRARLLPPDELSSGWDPLTDDRVSIWEVVVRLANALTDVGADEAARLMALAGRRVDLATAKELAYLLYSTCEKRGWTDSALLFNGLGTSWSDLAAAARGTGQTAGSAQDVLMFDDEEDEG